LEQAGPGSIMQEAGSGDDSSPTTKCWTPILESRSGSSH